MPEPLAPRDARFADEAALGLDPARIVAAQRLRVFDALDRSDATEAVAALDTYLDLEERILLDTAERTLPPSEFRTPDSRQREALLAEDNATSASRSRSRKQFEQHVRDTDGLFRALWSHLDEQGREQVAAALEEARLSREEGEPDLAPRHVTNDG